MTISNENFVWLSQVSKGLLTKSTVAQLQLPDSTEVNQLQYLATRLQPTPPVFQFTSLVHAKLVLTEFFSVQTNVKARVSAKSNRAIEALLLVDTEKRGASVNPFTYGVSDAN
jgi:hypothetical protein